MKSLLILGGTGFIGSEVLKCLSEGGLPLKLTIAQRDITRSPLTEIELIQYDRDSLQSCKRAFRDRSWDHVIDFCGTSQQRVLNTLSTLETDHYCFLSSSAVDLALPGDLYADMAKEKLWSEKTLVQGFDTLIVRSAFVVGSNDNSHRFECRAGKWFWRGTDRLVNPAINVELLASTIVTLTLFRHCGIVRAGYSIDSLLSNAL